MPAPKNTTKTEGSVTAIQTDTGGVQVVTNKIKDFNLISFNLIKKNNKLKNILTSECLWCTR